MEGPADLAVEIQLASPHAEVREVQLPIAQEPGELREGRGDLAGPPQVEVVGIVLDRIGTDAYLVGCDDDGEHLRPSA